MKVLMVLGTSAGGVGAHVKGLIGSLTGQGHTVVVACPPEVEEHFHPGEVEVLLHLWRTGDDHGIPRGR